MKRLPANGAPAVLAVSQGPHHLLTLPTVRQPLNLAHARTPSLGPQHRPWGKASSSPCHWHVANMGNRGIGVHVRPACPRGSVNLALHLGLLGFPLLPFPSLLSLPPPPHLPPCNLPWS